MGPLEEWEGQNQEVWEDEILEVPWESEIQEDEIQEVLDEI